MKKAREWWIVPVKRYGAAEFHKPDKAYRARSFGAAVGDSISRDVGSVIHVREVKKPRKAKR
jgi:hypothetical protein